MFAPVRGSTTWNLDMRLISIIVAFVVSNYCYHYRHCCCCNVVVSIVVVLIFVFFFCLARMSQWDLQFVVGNFIAVIVPLLSIWFCRTNKAHESPNNPRPNWQWQTTAAKRKHCADDLSNNWCGLFSIMFVHALSTHKRLHWLHEIAPAAAMEKGYAVPIRGFICCLWIVRWKQPKQVFEPIRGWNKPYWLVKSSAIANFITCHVFHDKLVVFGSCGIVDQCCDWPSWRCKRATRPIIRSWHVCQIWQNNQSYRFQFTHCLGFCKIMRWYITKRKGKASELLRAENTIPFRTLKKISHAISNGGVEVFEFFLDQMRRTVFIILCTTAIFFFGEPFVVSFSKVRKTVIWIITIQ